MPGKSPTAGDVEALRYEHDRLMAANAALERQVLELSTYVVVVQRLRGATGRGEVLAVVEEVLGAIVGTEQFALYAVDGASGSLQQLVACGVPFDPTRDEALLRGPLGKVTRQGELWVSEDPDNEELTACVPLLLGRRVIGAIAIFKMLPQKPALETADREIFDLLSRHVAVALADATLGVDE